MTKIICFGDSNTYGIAPDGTRYQANQRWPSLLVTLLNQKAGNELFSVIEDGQPNRTLVHNPPFSGEKTGLRYFKDSLAQSQPDLALLMLGTNDLKRKYNLSAPEIAVGLKTLIEQSLLWQPALNIMVICPPPILEVAHYADIYQGGAVKSMALEGEYQAIARELNCAFFAAGSVVKSSDVDGIHWSSHAHHHLANALSTDILSRVHATP